MGLPPSVATARVARSVAYLVNVQSVGLCLVGCAAVAACARLQLSFALDISVVVFGVTFALTFSITQAYQRRERALTTLAELKASIVTLYWQHRDWAQGPEYPASLGDDTTVWAREFASVALEFLDALQHYLVAADGYEGVGEVRLAAKRNATAHLLLGNAVLQHDVLGDTFIERVQRISSNLPGHPFLMRAYAALSKMSVMNEWLTHKAGYTRGGEGGMSRSAQYLRYLVAQMEQLRMIKIYRTPVMLRHACTVLVHVLTVLLAPYFQHAGRCDAGFPGPCPAPYIMACLWVLVTTLLLNVQASNEHPLDMTGIDDVFVELAGEFGDVLENTGRGTPVITGDACCFDVWREQFAARWGAAAAAAGG